MWRFLLQLPAIRTCPGVRPSLYALCSMLIAGFILADKVNDCLIYNQLFCPSSDSSYPCFSVGSSMKSWVPSCWHRAELSSVYLTLVLVGTGGAGWGPSLVGSLQWHCSDPGLARGDNLIRLISRCHHQAMSPPGGSVLPVEPGDLPEHLKCGPIIVTGGGGGDINSDPGPRVHQGSKHLG